MPSKRVAYFSENVAKKTPSRTNIATLMWHEASSVNVFRLTVVGRCALLASKRSGIRVLVTSMSQVIAYLVGRCALVDKLYACVGYG